MGGVADAQQAVGVPAGQAVESDVEEFDLIPGHQCVGEATLTELDRNLLAWRGINADTARALLAQAEKFGDVFKIRKELKATADLARTITWTGTDEQKKTLKKARASILAAITEAKRSLHESLAADAHDHAPTDQSTAALSAAELQELRTILAKLTQ